MKIYIELLITITIVLMFGIWKWWFIRSGKKLIEEYDPNNDKSRKGEIECGAITGEEPITRISDVRLVGPEQPKGRELLPKADVSNTRKNRFSIREFLKRRKK